MAIFTCKDCSDRHPGCHDHCEKYQNEKVAYEKRKADIRNEREALNYTKMLIYKRQNFVSKWEKSVRAYRRRSYD